MHVKSIYKKYINKKKGLYDRHEGNNIDYIRKHNPKPFYKLFS